MSLNRRLYIWLLGPDGNPAYFLKHAFRPLTSALKKLLVPQAALPVDPIRVSKISSALLDKWEIGGHVVPELFTPLMETVFANPEPGILISARSLFDAMDPAVIWSELFSWIEQGRVAMLNWVVDRFNLREEEMLVRHIPQVLLYILCLLKHCELRGAQWFELTERLIQLLPARAFSSAKGVELGSDLADIEVITHVRNYYAKVRGDAGVEVSLPEALKGVYFHRHLLSVLRWVGQPCPPNVDDYTLQWAVFTKKAAATVPPLGDLDLTPVLDNFNQRLSEDRGFLFLGTVIDTTIALAQHRHIHKETLQVESFSSVSLTFIHLLWRNLGADRTAYHVESVTYIWSLTAILSAATVESLLANEVGRSSSTKGGKLQACTRFSVLWKHAVDKTGTAAVLTKAMMLILRFLKSEEGSLGRVGVERWLAGLGGSAHRYIPSHPKLTAECLISSSRNCWRINCFDFRCRRNTKISLCRRRLWLRARMILRPYRIILTYCSRYSGLEIRI
jgi:hypothetical protein